MQPKAIINHPNLEGVSVTAQLLRGGERLRLKQARDRVTTRPVAVIGPDDKPVRNLVPVGPNRELQPVGDAQSIVMNYPLPVELQNEELKSWLVGLHVPGADGTTFSYSAEQAKEFAKDRARVIDDGLLWDDHLECTVTVAQIAPLVGEKVPEVGGDTEVKVPFARWILVNCEHRGIFDADPQGKH